MQTNGKLLIAVLTVLAIMALVFSCKPSKQDLSAGENQPDNHLPADQSHITVTENRFARSELTRLSPHLNLVDNGPSFGPNIPKLVRLDNQLFMYCMDKDSLPRCITLYSKVDGQSWERGQSIEVSRPPNILAGADGKIHLVGHQLFDTTNAHYGQLFHLVFKEKKCVNCDYDFEYISPDWRKNKTLETHVTYYTGAAIAEDNTIIVTYNNTFYNDLPNTLSAKIRNPKTGQWSFEIIATNMESRLCYPFTLFHKDQIHVVAIEDAYDSTLIETGYPYRYGLVKYFHRKRDGTKWQQSTLINLNKKYTRKEVWNMQLKVSDLYIDSKDTMHILIRTNEAEVIIYHYRKHIDSQRWKTNIGLKNARWARIWENEKGELFYVTARWKRVEVIPEKKPLGIFYISEKIWRSVPTISLSNTYSGKPVHSQIDVLNFSSHMPRQAVVIECKLKNDSVGLNE